MAPSFCVCVPARDEAGSLGRFLNALAAQDRPGVIQIAICLNNTTDGSADIVAERAIRHAGRLAITLDRHDFPPDLAHAGAARRRAMESGIAVLGGAADAVLIMTDADTVPPPCWIGANLAAIQHGGDPVGGRLLIDDPSEVPAALRRLRAAWERYWVAVRAVEDRIDPRPWDPPPRHGDHTGASLAISVALYRAAGGVPLVPLGEDRALVEAAQGAGGRLVHPMTVWTRVSGRTQGRAAGGMADAQAALSRQAATGVECMVPALDHWAQRAAARRALRNAANGAARIACAEQQAPKLPHDARLFEIPGV